MALQLASDTMAADAESADDSFLRIEAAGVMIRIEPTVTPTMATTPTIGTWELNLLRTGRARRRPRPLIGVAARDRRDGIGRKGAVDQGTLGVAVMRHRVLDRPVRARVARRVKSLPVDSA